MTERKELSVVFSLEKEYAAKKDEVPEGGWTPVTTGQYKRESSNYQSGT